MNVDRTYKNTNGIPAVLIYYRVIPQLRSSGPVLKQTNFGRKVLPDDASTAF